MKELQGSNYLLLKRCSALYDIVYELICNCIALHFPIRISGFLSLDVVRHLICCKSDDSAV